MISESDELVDGREHPPVAKRKRGPYKQYLFDPTIAVPRTTLLSRQKAQASTTLAQDVQIDNREAHQEPNAAINDEVVNAAETDDRNILQQQDVGDNPEQLTGLTDPNSVPPEVNHHGLSSQKSHVHKHNLSELLHPASTLTRLDALLMILHMAVRHCHTQHFIEDKIKFLNAVFGSVVLDVSYHVFKTLFKSTVDICRHYVCVDCEVYLGSQKDLSSVKFMACPQCNKEINVHSVDSGNYFITVPVREQIQELLTKPNLKFLSRSNRDPTKIADICDGEIYKKLSAPGCPLANENALTVCFNTDGVSVHKSSSNSLWPIQLYINEIVPEQRLKVDNLILAGLWFGKSCPNMSLYLKPVFEKLIDLSANGVARIKPDGSRVICPVYPLICSVDSVAKAKVLCQKQFNARMGCLYCYQSNSVTIGDNNKLRYYDQSINFDLRTEEQVLRDMFEADGLGRRGGLGTGSVNGFIGISILTMFSKIQDFASCNPFNIVWGVAVDYMHAALEGTDSDLFNIFENILTAEKLKSLDEFIKNITPPQGMTRKPRSFTLRPFWKAREFRAFLLYYSLPCFQELLPVRNYINLKQFVHVMHILLSDSILPQQLTEAATSLSNFVIGYQKLYGLQNVSYNLHLCRHLLDMVVQHGPLWCYSNFLFESGNG